MSAAAVLGGGGYPADRDLRRFDAMARQLPVFATSAPAIDRLESVFTATGASASVSAGFRYIVETDAADGWEEEIFRWYDVEHMPALAAVPCCVHAPRSLNRGGGPRSH